MISFARFTCLIAIVGLQLGRAQSDFLYTGSGDLTKLQPLFKKPEIQGVQIVYTWKSLEPAKGQYDFSQIKEDLRILETVRKKLFIQIQDRFFRPQDKNVPAYLIQDPAYGGGITPQSDNPGEGKPKGSGWVANQWNPNVRQRFQLLLQTLAKEFDGRVYGINLPETAIDIDMKHAPFGFNCDAYFSAEIENMQAAKTAFTKSYVVQYVNFWPCEWDNDHKYMSRMFELAAQLGVGLGGPDIIPNRRGEMKNSYPFFHQYKERLVLVAMAVQEPTLTYTNPATGRRFTESELRNFGGDYLGARVIFWSTSSPWLRTD
ncbi:MAG TPA: hypothetical protein VKT81_01145 [Bryobacteraceae bacterium]|nr:hypothetical protein [Bryobacteraceae bacterium]